MRLRSHAMMAPERRLWGGWPPPQNADKDIPSAALSRAGTPTETAARHFLADMQLYDTNGISLPSSGTCHASSVEAFTSAIPGRRSHKSLRQPSLPCLQLADATQSPMELMRAVREGGYAYRAWPSRSPKTASKTPATCVAEFQTDWAPHRTLRPPRTVPASLSSFCRPASQPSLQPSPSPSPLPSPSGLLRPPTAPAAPDAFRDGARWVSEDSIRHDVRRSSKVSRTPTSRRPSKERKEAPGLSGSRRASRAGAELHVHSPVQIPAEAMSNVPDAPPARAPLVSDEREFAKQLSIPLRVVQEACELFQAHADIDSDDDEPNASPKGTKMLRGGHITKWKAGRLLGLDLDDGFAVDLTFGDFALLYNSHGFAADVMLSPKSRQVRDVAVSHGVSLTDMDRYKKAFDEVDLDSSGSIDAEEFSKAVCRLVRVPAGLELPAKRVQILWREADTDGRGKLDLEKFIVFYTKYFDNSDGANPLEGFYIRPRRNSSAMFEMEY